MTESEFHSHRDTVHPHEHAVFVYDDENGMLAPLELFIEEGVKTRDLSVFVHSFPNNERARQFLGGKIPQIGDYERRGDLTAASYRDSFEKGGHIDYGHVGGVVEMLRGTAAQSGRRAPRVFVDASKNYFDSGRVDEWFDFESWLGPRLQAEMGLVCAYRARDLADPEILRRVLETHEYRFDAPRRRHEH